MAREQKRKERAVLVTKALLLGYEFKWRVFSAKGCYMLLPNGMYYSEDQYSTYGIDLVYRPYAFPALWVAATKALQLSGVIDAQNPSGNSGVGSSQSYRLPKRRRKRSSPKSQLESAGAGSQRDRF